MNNKFLGIVATLGGWLVVITLIGFLPDRTPTWIVMPLSLIGGFVVAQIGYKIYHRKPKPPAPPDDPLPQ